MQMETDNKKIGKQNHNDCNKKDYNLGFISDEDIHSGAGLHCTER